MRILEIASGFGALMLIAGMIFPFLRHQQIESDRQRATSDLRAISQAVHAFLDDVGQGPTRSPTGDDRGLYRLHGPGRWANEAYSQDDALEGALEAHLCRNAPGAGAAPYERWSGPYWAEPRPDPWGHAYVLVAYPLFLDDARSVIVVCAGQNGEFDADYSSPIHHVPVGDDLLEVVVQKGPQRRGPLY